MATDGNCQIHSKITLVIVISINQIALCNEKGYLPLKIYCKSVMQMLWIQHFFHAIILYLLQKHVLLSLVFDQHKRIHGFHTQKQKNSKFNSVSDQRKHIHAQIPHLNNRIQNLRGKFVFVLFVLFIYLLSSMKMWTELQRNLGVTTDNAKHILKNVKSQSLL